jgi:hypothetical protein
MAHVRFGAPIDALLPRASQCTNVVRMSRNNARRIRLGDPHRALGVLAIETLGERSARGVSIPRFHPHQPMHHPIGLARRTDRATRAHKQ